MYYPIFSTLFIVLVFPWLSNVAYYLWQRANSFKIQTRLKFENSAPLTLSQSIELRKEVQRKDMEFNELLHGKNESIQSLEDQLKYLNEQLNQKESELINTKESTKKQPELSENNSNNDERYKEWLKEFNERTISNRIFQNEFDEVLDYSFGSLGRPLDSDTLRYFVSGNIIEFDPQSKEAKLTDKGRYFANLWTTKSNIK